MQTIAPWSHAFANLALPWILQSLVISLCALVLARVLRRKGPTVENVVLRFGLVALWLAPAATILFSYLHIGGVSVALPQPIQKPTVNTSTTAELPSQIVPPPMQPIPQPLAIPQAQPVNAPAVTSHIDPLATAYAAIVCLWILGATFLLLRLAALYATLLHVCWTAAQAPAPLCELLDKHSAAMRIRAPRLRTHDRVNGPCVTGLLRSTILLPPTFANSDPRLIESVLLHELSHAKRRDCAWNLLAYITASILWFQPLLWRIRRRLDETSDLIADDCVIHDRREPVEYARHLANLAEACMPTRAEFLATAGIAPSKSELVKRVRRILDVNRLIQLRTSRKLVTAIALTAALITTATGIIGAESGGDFPIDPIEGTVYSTKGEPIAGAVVELTERLPKKDDENAPEQVRSIAKTTSAADGTFSIPAQRGTAPEHSRELLISAPGFVPQELPMRYDAQHPQRFYLDYYDRPSANADVALWPARSLSGSVKDRQGRPIANAKVSTSDSRSQATTDAAGKFTIDAVTDYSSTAEYRQYNITASHPDYVSGNTIAPMDAVDVSIMLDPGAIIEGVVRDRETSEAVAGIRVYSQSRRDRQNAVTDADGKYRLRVEPGQVALSIPSHRFGDPRIVGYMGTVEQTPVFVAEGDTKAGVDLQVTRGKLLLGRVLDAVSKQPVPEMHIRVHAESERERRPIGRPGGVTDEQGQFSISGLAPGKYTFFGFDLDSAAVATNEVTVDISGDSLPDPIELIAKQLPPNAGGMLTGTLVYPDGKPAPLAQVRVFVDNPRGEREMEQCRTSPDGAFGFEMAMAFLEMQGPGEFRATDNTGKYVALLELADVSKPPQPFVLTLQKGATFSGTVRDDKGQPMPGIFVVVNRDIPQGSGSLRLQQGLSSGTTDAEGKYVTTAYIASSRDKNVELECMIMPSNERKYQFSYMPEGKYTNLNAMPGAHTVGLDFVLKVDGNNAHFVPVAKEQKS